MATSLPRNFCTLIDLLEQRAGERPDQTLYTFLENGETEAGRLSFRQLQEKARQIAGFLQSQGYEGERILLLFPPGLDFIVALFACFYAKVTAVPVYPPDPLRLERTLPRLQGILKDAKAKGVLTLSWIQQMAPQLGDLASGSLQWLSLDQLPLSTPWKRPKVDESTLAFLQYTSGSTGDPKGVMVSHGNLLHNLEIIRNCFGLDENSRGISWLPPYHDMGLIGGILEPLYIGGFTVLFSPVDFLKQPVRWLNAITRYQGTTCGGPNFAYELCIRKISEEQKASLDLSTWDLAFNGAEPIRAATLDRFVEAFAPHGFRREVFYPCYGLAEGTLIVSGGEKFVSPVTAKFNREKLSNKQAVSDSENGDANTLVGCGASVGGQSLRIVDPESRKVQADGKIGEIWVQGPSVAQGYWNKPQETEGIFHATLADEKGGKFLRTGDLGFFQNGELFVTGRSKDLIIINGVNHYPHDIEIKLENRFPELRSGAGAAFSIHEDGEERLVVVWEMEQEKDSVWMESLVKVLSEELDLSLHAAQFIEPKSLPKTSSGKVSRIACRDGFIGGSLRVRWQWCSKGTAINMGNSVESVAQAEAALPEEFKIRTHREIQGFLQEKISRHLGIPLDQVDPTKPFGNFGLDSKAALGIAGDLEVFLGKSLPITLMWQYPTIEKLSLHLTGEDRKEKIAYLSEARPPFEPIAIVGMSCRFPKAKNPESFWQLLRDGVHAITEVPKDRWEIDEFFDTDIEAPAKMVTKWGGFLENLDQFDAEFFGISPKEAKKMDPQQRLVLELSWEALENAGIAPSSVAGKRGGVFLGIAGTDYSTEQMNDPLTVNAYAGTGNAHSIAANRLSYFLDLHGPSVALDTACSSSMVAIHLAVQGLRSGETDLALAGGVNLILRPEVTIVFSKARMMSPRGRCATFDSQADGYVRGEGCGMLVLKRLSDALKDGDPIQAIIRGSAVNQDGRSSSLTAPNGLAQQAVMREALLDGGLSSADISYIEAHGTGTPIGDPIEMNSLGEVFQDGHSLEKPCLVGSVKTNIGHLEVASGVAGIIKVILAMQHREIPPHLHLKKINEYIPLDRLPLQIPTVRTPWAVSGKPRRAGINSFGFGGANAHIVLEEAPAESQRVQAQEAVPYLFKLSAVNEDSLKDMVQRYQSYLENHSAVSLKDLCYTANCGRGDFEYRLALVAKSVEELQKSLGEIGRGESGKNKIRRAKQRQKPLIGFLFSGQGSQYAGMGRQLYQTQSVFRQTLDECDALLRERRGFSLLDLLFPKSPEGESPIHETIHTQPALYALEYALTRLWSSWGIEPDFVMGHSVGEYVAAAVAGVYSWQEGLLLISERAALMQGLSKDGGMLAVLGEPETVEQMMLPFDRDLSIAAVNGPKNVVISGKNKALKVLEKELQARGLATQPLVVSHAFHSPMMDSILDTFEKKAREIQFHSPKLPLISNLKGKFFDPGEIPNAKYWTQHLRGTVRFLEGMKALADQHCDLFLEIGPQPVLTQLGKRCLSEGKITWLPSLKRGSEDNKIIQESLGELYLEGVTLRWEGLYADGPGKRLNLPTYPFRKESFWLENLQERINPLNRGASKGFGPVIHPILGGRIQTPIDHLMIFEHQILLDALPFLRDHRLENEVIFPAAGYADLALKAAQEFFGNKDVVLEELVIQQAMFLEEKVGLRLQVTLEREIGSQSAFKIFSQSKSAATNGQWTLHAQGRVTLNDSGLASPRLVKDALNEIQARCSGEVEISQFYQGLKFQGLNYGPFFQGVQKLWKGEGEALGEIYISKELARKDQFCFHPALLDAALQVLAGVHADEAALKEKKQIYLPVEFRKVRFQSNIPEKFWSHAGFTEREGSKNAYGHIRFLDGEGRLVGTIEEVVFKPLPGLQGKSDAGKEENWHYRIHWEEKPLSSVPAEESSAKGTWLLFDDGGDLGAGLADALETRGGTVLRIIPGQSFSNPTEFQFILRPEAPEDFEKLLEAAFGQTAPACRGIIHLWSLRSENSETDLLKNFDQAQDLSCHSVLHLVQALGKNPKLCLTQLTLVTRGGQRPERHGGSLNLQAAPLWGLGKVIALENPEMHCLRVDLPLLEGAQEPEEILQEVLHGDGEDQVVLREGRRWVSRLAADSSESASLEKSEKGKTHRKLQAPATGTYRVGIHKAGTLDSVVLVPCERKTALADHEVELEVRAAGLNFSDVLKALGLYPGLGDGPVPLGIECSGKVVRVGVKVKKYQKGDEVITVAPFCFGKYVVSLEDDLMPKPPQISFEEAATIPVAFLTAYYALVHLGRIQKGERILIHAGAGGVGLAAIQIAKLFQCEIFATAGSPEKRKFLQDLQVHHVMDSRSLKFAEEIRKVTEGRGVDIVLNSLSGDFIPASLSVLGSYGRFLEIGKIDIYTNSKIGLLPFQDNLSYFAIDLDRLFRQRPEQARTLFAELIELFMKGKLEPLPHTDFPLSDLTQAFRYMAQRKNTGKVIVQMPSGTEEDSHGQTGILSGEKTYLVTGGMGSLGLRVARWLVDQGARHLVLLGRGGRIPETESQLREMEQAGAAICVLKADVSQWKDLESVFKKIQKEMPPLAGVIHAAGVLEDGILHQIDRGRFQRVMAPKALGAIHLHRLTEKMTLDFFVLFSSIASVLGSPGQGNYTAANSFLDALAQYRRDLGLPALSINWGPWGDGGMATGMIASQDFEKRGLKVLSTEKGLEILGTLLNSREPQQVVVSSDWNLLGQAYPKNRVPSVLASLYQPSQSVTGGGESNELKQLMAKFKSLPQGERQKWLEQMIQRRVADALDTDPERVDSEKPLNTMGLDSLMALELKNEIENVLGVVIPITFLIKGPSLRELAEFVVNDLEALAS